jgi:hypothetical protein
VPYVRDARRAVSVGGWRLKSTGEQFWTSARGKSLSIPYTCTADMTGSPTGTVFPDRVAIGDCECENCWARVGLYAEGRAGLGTQTSTSTPTLSKAAPSGPPFHWRHSMSPYGHWCAK